DLNALPPVLREIVPYTLNYDVGQLAPGDHKILFNLGLSPARESDFNVAHAQDLAIDDYPYANVSSVEIPDTVNGSRSVQVTLVGEMITTCEYIKEVTVLPE